MTRDRRMIGRDKAAAIDAALAQLWPDGRDAVGRDINKPDAQSEILHRVEAIWDDVPRLRGRERYAELLGAPTLREQAVARWWAMVDWLDRVGRVPAFAAMAAIVLVLGIGIVAISLPGDRRFETARAQTRTISLDDGSEVTLGAQSALEVDYAQNARKVTLSAGEAFFSVAHDSSRPFFVTAGDTIVRVVGTKFNVNRTPQGVRVSVLEGVVRVTEHRPASAKVEEVAIRRGQQVTAEATAPKLQVSTLSLAEPGGWRSGNLTYESATLAQIVADTNRYHDSDIRIASARGAEMRLTTSFRIDQVDQFLETVKTALPLDISRDAEGNIVIVDRR